MHEKIIDVVTHLLRRRLPPTNTMVENIVGIELAYINTKHPDFHEVTLVQKTLTEGIELPKNINKDVVPTSRQNSDNKEQTKVLNNTMPQESSWKLSSLIKTKNLDVGTASAPSSVAGSPAHHTRKGVNLLSEVPSSEIAKNQSPKDKRDCEVIECLIRAYFRIVRKNIQDSIPKAIMHFLVNHVKDNLQSELVSQLYKKEEIEYLLEESDHIAQRRKEAQDMLKALQRASHIIGEIRETHLW